MAHPQILLSMRRNGAEKTYALAIAGRSLRAKPRANTTVYVLCDVDRVIPKMLDCDGELFPIKVVLKVYARIPQSALDKQRYARLVLGKPCFTK